MEIVDAANRKIRIQRGDRVFFVGTTGSGKTHLATMLLARQKHIVVIDPKHGFSWEKMPHQFGPGIIAYDRQDMLRFTSKKDNYGKPIIYRPNTIECKTGVSWLFDWVFWRGNTIVYVDEVMSITPPVNIPFSFARCIQQGRSREVGVWCGTQRPARIPIPILSESEHDFIFRLRHPADTKRMAEYSDPVILKEPATGHDFWYYGDRTQTLFKDNANTLRIS